MLLCGRHQAGCFFCSPSYHGTAQISGVPCLEKGNFQNLISCWRMSRISSLNVGIGQLQTAGFSLFPVVSPCNLAPCPPHHGFVYILRVGSCIGSFVIRGEFACIVNSKQAGVHIYSNPKSSIQTPTKRYMEILEAGIRS